MTGNTKLAVSFGNVVVTRYRWLLFDDKLAHKLTKDVKYKVIAASH